MLNNSQTTVIIKGVLDKDHKDTAVQTDILVLEFLHRKLDHTNSKNYSGCHLVMT